MCSSKKTEDSWIVERGGRVASKVSIWWERRKWDKEGKGFEDSRQRVRIGSKRVVASSRVLCRMVSLDHSGQTCMILFYFMGSQILNRNEGAGGSI